MRISQTPPPTFAGADSQHKSRLFVCWYVFVYSFSMLNVVNVMLYILVHGGCVGRTRFM